MTTTSKLSKASSLFFVSGFVIGKIQNFFQIPVVSPICAVLALIFNMMGYTLWLISSRFYPEHTRKIKEWYGFAQFKEQHLLAALIGILGTVFSLAAFLCPVLIIPAVWLFFASNIVWSLSEYHKLNNPPSDRTYSSNFQEKYFAYTVIVTAITTLAAISATLVFFIPPIALPVLIASTIAIVGLSLLSFEVWLSFTFRDQKKPTNTTLEADSTMQMAKTLGPSSTNEDRPSTAPAANNSLFATPQSSPIPTPENATPSSACAP